MKPWLEGWEARCAAAPALRFVDVNLRGVGQVMFQDNPMSGLLFLAAVAWGSFAGGVPAVFGASVLGVIVATLTAMWLRVDTSALHAGLMGYNGVLVGAALATFIAPSATVDTDGDGLIDGEEVNTYKTNPNKADTDGDGFSDGTEVRSKHDPLKK